MSAPTYSSLPPLFPVEEQSHSYAPPPTAIIPLGSTFTQSDSHQPSDRVALQSKFNSSSPAQFRADSEHTGHGMHASSGPQHAAHQSTGPQRSNAAELPRFEGGSQGSRPDFMTISPLNLFIDPRQQQQQPLAPNMTNNYNNNNNSNNNIRFPAAEVDHFYTNRPTDSEVNQSFAVGYDRGMHHQMGLVPEQAMQHSYQQPYRQSSKPPPGKHKSLAKPEHANSLAKRRGPMDEMRQLVRILVKVMPNSINMLAAEEESQATADGMHNKDGTPAQGKEGSGNKVNNNQIRTYLTNALGEMQEPPWGVPLGWGSYVAALFSWVLDCEHEPITQEQAMNCARRPQGRSWEAVDDQIRKLGLFPTYWQHPLRLHEVRADNAKGAKDQERDIYHMPPPPPALKHMPRGPAQSQQSVSTIPSPPLPPRMANNMPPAYNSNPVYGPPAFNSNPAFGLPNSSGNGNPGFGQQMPGGAGNRVPLVMNSSSVGQSVQTGPLQSGVGARLMQPPHASDPSVILVMQKQAQALAQLLAQQPPSAGQGQTQDELLNARQQQQFLGQRIQQLEQRQQAAQAPLRPQQQQLQQAFEPVRPTMQLPQQPAASFTQPQQRTPPPVQQIAPVRQIQPQQQPQLQQQQQAVQRPGPQLQQAQPAASAAAAIPIVPADPQAAILLEMQELGRKETERAQEAARSMGQLHQRLQEAVAEGIRKKAQDAEAKVQLEARLIAEAKERQATEAREKLAREQDTVHQLNVVLKQITDLQATKAVYDANVQVNLNAMFRDAVRLQGEVTRQNAARGQPPDDQTLQQLRRLQVGYSKEAGAPPHVPFTRHAANGDEMSCDHPSQESAPENGAKVKLEQAISFRNQLGHQEDMTTDAQVARFEELMTLVGMSLSEKLASQNDSTSSDGAPKQEAVAGATGHPPMSASDFMDTAKATATATTLDPRLTSSFREPPFIKNNVQGLPSPVLNGSRVPVVLAPAANPSTFGQAPLDADVWQPAKAASRPNEDTHSALECAACMDEFSFLDQQRRPMILPCSHTFCFNCISHFSSKTCPTCRTRFHEAQPNFILRDLMTQKAAAARVSGDPKDSLRHQSLSAPVPSVMARGSSASGHRDGSSDGALPSAAAVQGTAAAPSGAAASVVSGSTGAGNVTSGIRRPSPSSHRPIPLLEEIITSLIKQTHTSPNSLLRSPIKQTTNPSTQPARLSDHRSQAAVAAPYSAFAPVPPAAAAAYARFLSANPSQPLATCQDDTEMNESLPLSPVGGNSEAGGGTSQGALAARSTASGGPLERRASGPLLTQADPYLVQPAQAPLSVSQGATPLVRLSSSAEQPGRAQMQAALDSQQQQQQQRRFKASIPSPDRMDVDMASALQRSNRNSQQQQQQQQDPPRHLLPMRDCARDQKRTHAQHILVALKMLNGISTHHSLGGAVSQLPPDQVADIATSLGIKFFRIQPFPKSREGLACGALGISMFAAQELQQPMICTSGPVQVIPCSPTDEDERSGSWVLTAQYGTRCDLGTHSTDVQKRCALHDRAFATCYSLATREYVHPSMISPDRLDMLQKHRPFPVYVDKRLTPVVIYEWGRPTPPPPTAPNSRMNNDIKQPNNKPVYVANQQDMFDTMSANQSQLLQQQQDQQQLQQQQQQRQPQTQAAGKGVRSSAPQPQGNERVEFALSRLRAQHRQDKKKEQQDLSDSMTQQQSQQYDSTRSRSRPAHSDSRTLSDEDHASDVCATAASPHHIAAASVEPPSKRICVQDTGLANSRPRRGKLPTSVSDGPRRASTAASSHSVGSRRFPSESTASAYARNRVEGEGSGDAESDVEHD